MANLATSNGQQQAISNLSDKDIIKREFKAIAGIPTISKVNEILKAYGAGSEAIKAQVISAELQIIVIGIWQLLQQGQTLTVAAQTVKSKIEKLDAEKAETALSKSVESSEESTIQKRSKDQGAQINDAFLTQMKADALESGARLEALKFILLGAARNSKQVQEDPRVVAAREVAMQSPTDSLLNDEVYNNMIASGVNFFD